MTALRVAWQQLRRQPLFTAMAVLLVISSLLAAGAGLLAYQAQRATSAQNDRLEELVVELQDQRDLASARSCASAWEGRTGVRAIVEALVTAATRASEEAVAAFRADIARRLPDPDCDLDAALEVIAEAERPPPAPD